MRDSDAGFWNRVPTSSESEGKGQAAEESDLLRIERKIDRIQCFLNDNYRELEESLKKQKSYFNALEIMFYILLGISLAQFIFLMIR